MVLGGTPLAGGRGTIAGTIAAVLVLGVTSNLLNLLEVSAFVQMLIKGLIVILAILVNQPARGAWHEPAHTVPGGPRLAAPGRPLRDLDRAARAARGRGAAVRRVPRPNYLLNILRQAAPVGIAAVGVTS